MIERSERSSSVQSIRQIYDPNPIQLQLDEIAEPSTINTSLSIHPNKMNNSHISSNHQPIRDRGRKVSKSKELRNVIRKARFDQMSQSLVNHFPSVPANISEFNNMNYLSSGGISDVNTSFGQAPGLISAPGQSRRTQSRGNFKGPNFVNTKAALVKNNSKYKQKQAK